MNYFITGASGFLGKQIEYYFKSNAIKFVAPDRKNLFKYLCKSTDIDILIHCAGKAHSFKDPDHLYFDSNVKLTKKITESISTNNIALNTFVFISSVAVYGLEKGSNLNEDTYLKSSSPYATSKKLAEDHLLLWAKSNHVNLVILRLPLIFGENPPGNLGAMAKAICNGYYFRISDGCARRSMVHVKQLSQFIPSLLGKNGIFHLTDGHHPTYAEVEDFYANKFNKTIYSLPFLLLKFISFFGDFIPF